MRCARYNIHAWPLLEPHRYKSNSRAGHEPLCGPQHNCSTLLDSVEEEIRNVLVKTNLGLGVWSRWRLWRHHMVSYSKRPVLRGSDEKESKKILSQNEIQYTLLRSIVCACIVLIQSAESDIAP